MNKIVAVINKSLEPGRAMNALAHISLGLGASLGSEQLELMDYVDKEGNRLPNISKRPFVILRATGGKIKSLYLQIRQTDIHAVFFTDTMTVGTWEEQAEKTLVTSHEDLIFYGVVLFGPHEAVAELTKKFSLWK